jgi:heme-degrading monooxygenase HmoA
MIAVIFEVTPKDGGKEEYLQIATQLKKTLLTINGFISIERFQSLSDSNRFLSLSFWQDEKSVKVWRNNVLHQQAQDKGKNDLFKHYRIRVANVLRDYGSCSEKGGGVNGSNHLFK